MPITINLFNLSIILNNIINSTLVYFYEKIHFFERAGSYYRTRKQS